MLSITSGAGLQIPSFKNICFIGLLISFTLEGIFSSPTTTSPFSSPAHNFILSNVTGRTFPLILNISDIFSTAFAKLPVISVIATINKFPSE
ncbi:hypothetical protein D3C71_1642560 [compost metagenome]